MKSQETIGDWFRLPAKMQVGWRALGLGWGWYRLAAPHSGRTVSDKEAIELSMRDLETAFSNMRANAHLMDFMGPRPEDLVSAAETAIGFAFPATFRRFALELGADNFGATEIYGVTTDNFVSATVPNGVWRTLQDRAKGYIPPSFFEVYDTGIGSVYCLDLARRDAQGECPVFEIYLGDTLDAQPSEPVAEDFGSLLLYLVQRELEFHSEEDLEKDMD